MRRDIGGKVDVADMRALGEIDDAERMARMRVPAVDAVAENRHIGKPGFRHQQELMHGALKAVEHGLCLECLRIEKQDFGAHLVDGDHSMACSAHCPGSRLYSRPFHYHTGRELL